MTRQTSAELFSSAARELINAQHRGKQAEVARLMRVKPAYLSDLLSEKRKWSDDMRDRFASALHLSVADLFVMGEELNKTGRLFPHFARVKDTAPASKERAVRIWVIASEDYKLRMGTNILNWDAIKTWNPKIFEEYLRGEVSDILLYETARALFKHFVSAYLK